MPLATARPKFCLGVARTRGTVVVTARGLLDGDSSPALRKVLADLIDGQGNLAVVIDLRELAVAGSAWLEVFAATARAAHRRGGVLTLADPSDSMARALRAAGLGGLAVETRP